MSKYETINGWTKAKMLAVIRARPFDGPAISSSGTCEYLSKNGNKCGVGLFLPDGHDAQNQESVSRLLTMYPELKQLLPLGGAGLSHLQAVHDIPRTRWTFGDNAKAAILHFVETEVYDE